MAQGKRELRASEAIVGVCYRLPGQENAANEGLSTQRGVA